MASISDVSDKWAKAQFPIYLPYKSSHAPIRVHIRFLFVKQWIEDHAGATKYTTGNAKQTHKSKEKAKKGSMDVKQFEQLKLERHTIQLNIHSYWETTG